MSRSITKRGGIILLGAVLVAAFFVLQNPAAQAAARINQCPTMQATNIPVDLMLVMDDSSSMTNERVEAAKNAADTAVNTILSTSTDPPSRVGVVFMNNNGGATDTNLLLAASTSSLSVEIDKLDGSFGVTPLLDTIVKAAGKFTDFGDNTSDVIMFFSDGQCDFCNSHTPDETKEKLEARLASAGFSSASIDAITIAGVGLDLTTTEMNYITALASSPSLARSATSASLTAIFNELVIEVSQSGDPSTIDADGDGAWPIYCQSVAGNLCDDSSQGAPCTDYYDSPADWGLANSLRAAFATATNDLDGDDEPVYDISPLGLTDAQLTAIGLDPDNPHPGNDLNDQNVCVSPKAPEGKCIVSKQECENIWTETDCTNANNNICNLYRDNNVPNFYAACAEQIPVNSGTFYAGCTDTDINDNPIDNDQDGVANKAELSCPKPGGLVPCGRYADDPNTPNINESEPCGFCHFFFLFDNIINRFVWQIIPLIAALLLVIGGLAIATSRGDSSQLTKGKNILIWTFAGYTIILVGWMVLNSFFTGIGVKSWTGFGEDGEITSVTLITEPGTDIIRTNQTDWEEDDWNEMFITITESPANPALEGEKRKILDTFSSGSLKTQEWDPTNPSGGESFRIGGWWQFSCGTK